MRLIFLSYGLFRQRHRLQGQEGPHLQFLPHLHVLPQLHFADDFFAAFLFAFLTMAFPPMFTPVLGAYVGSSIPLYARYY